ncbi:nuclear speckle splicing regulatory protein 1 [Dermacentor andersoni]|uniref:nuclear speckle splicing regulatory protein 1 n=1 Tax=Dermacentor andersoni TaxID=34620 RepID=UPI003B3AE10F
MAAPKKYGLILPKKNDKPALSSACVFGDDSDDEHDKASIEKTMRKESMRNLKKIQTQLTLKKAMEEDPSVFEYDEVYDDLKKNKEEKKQEVTKDRKPRYIEQLLKSAELRKREGDRRTQRKIQKERETEGEAFGDKEAYVTSAYKRKMQEMQEEEEREMRQEQLNQMMDVTKQKDLSGFYRHLLKQEVGEERIPQNTDKPVEWPEKDEKPRTSKSIEEPSPAGRSSPENCKTSSSSSQRNRDSGDSQHSTQQATSEKHSESLSRKDRRGYRTRKISDPSEDEGSPPHNEPSASENVDRDIDADSDFEVDSEESSDEDESHAALPKEKENTSMPSSKRAKEDQLEANDGGKEDTTKEPATKVIERDWTALFRKRTVGDKFEAALARYFERKAELDVYRAAHGSVQ